jgi:hypothetical protein
MGEKDIHIQQTVQAISQDSAGVHVEHAENVHIYTSVNEQPKKQLSNGWQIEPPEKIEHIESADAFVNLLIGYHDVLCPYRAEGMSPLQNELADAFYAFVQDYAMYGFEDLTSDDMRKFRQEMREQFDLLLQNGLVVCAVGKVGHYVYNNNKTPMRITHVAVKKLELSSMTLALLAFCSAESEEEQNRYFNEILKLKPDLDVSKEQLLAQLNETKEKLTLLISPIVKLDEAGEIQNKNEILNLFYDITINAQDKSPKMFINDFAKIEEPNAPDGEYAKAVGAEKKRLKQILDSRERLVKEIHLLINLLNQKEYLLFGGQGFDAETTALHVLELLFNNYTDSNMVQNKNTILSFYTKYGESYENDIKVEVELEDGYFKNLIQDFSTQPESIDFQDTPHSVRVAFYASMVKQYIKQQEHKLTLEQYFDIHTKKKWVSPV